MNRVYIKTYGCQMNERDSEQVARSLRDRGYSIVDSEQEADTVLLNTCSVRDQAEQKAIGKAGYLAKRKRETPGFRIGVLGCMAQNRGADLLEKLPDLDLIAGTQKFHRVPDLLDNLIRSETALGPRPSALVDVEEEAGSQNAIRHRLPRPGQVRAYVSIMQGCNMNCAFCIVPKTRGRERARPMESIVEEVEELVAGGVKEVTLLGQIVTSYGRREFPAVGGKSPFVQLLEKLNDVRGLERIRFTSPHPRGFKQDLVEAYRDLPKLCEYAHLPLQAGCDATLRAMNRPYTTRRYREIVEALRTAAPDMHLSTDVIVGFPGETEAQFEESARFFEEMRFDMAYIFKYSVRSGTPAASMPDQTPQEEKERRNQVLLEILGRSSLARNRSLVGTRQQVLVEGRAKRGERFAGKTRGFRNTLFEGSDRLVGELIDVEIREATASSLYGDAVLTGVDG